MWSYLRRLVQPHRQYKMFYNSQYKRVLREFAERNQLMDYLREELKDINLSESLSELEEASRVSRDNLAQLDKRLAALQSEMALQGRPTDEIVH